MTTIPQELRTTLRMLAQGREPWWHRYGELVPNWLDQQLALEHVALSIHSYDDHFVPALLQTPDYARAINAIRFGTDDLDRHVELAMRRQEVWLQHRLPELWVVIDETVLRRPLGGVEVMRAQIRHLIELAELDHITIQVCPVSSAAPYGSLTVVHLPGQLPQVVYLEYPTGINVVQDVEHYRGWFDQAILTAHPSFEAADDLARLLQEL